MNSIELLNDKEMNQICGGIVSIAHGIVGDYVRTATQQGFPPTPENYEGSGYNNLGDLLTTAMYFE